jgi:hypothetical protein
MPSPQVIIIAKDQRDNLEEMLFSLRAQLPSFPRLFVLDRCTDSSAEYLGMQGERFLEKFDGEGWEAGKVRNRGLEFFKYSGDFFLLDGDRFPSGLTEEIVLKALKLYDVTLMPVERDPRKWIDNSIPGKFSDNPNIGERANGFYTPGFTIRDKALKKCIAANGGNLFNPLMDGVWGYEDMAFGDLAASLELSCGAFPGVTWVSGGFDTKNTEEAYLRNNSIRTEIAKRLYEQNKGKLKQWWL